MNRNNAAKSYANNNLGMNGNRFMNSQNKNFTGNFKQPGTILKPANNFNYTNSMTNSMTNTNGNGNKLNPTSDPVGTIHEANPSSTLNAKEILNPEKIKKPRLKLDEKTLLYSENGIKKFYEIMEKTEFREKANEVKLLKNY
jgi:hypothetical protein